MAWKDKGNYTRLVQQPIITSSQTSVISEKWT